MQFGATSFTVNLYCFGEHILFLVFLKRQFVRGTTARSERGRQRVT